MSINPALLIDTFTPQTLASTADGMGGVTEAWSDGTTFKGRLSSLPIDERMAADKVTVYATHRLYCNNMTCIGIRLMVAGTRFRGHAAYTCDNGKHWYYSDNGEMAVDARRGIVNERPCIKCGRMSGPEGYDACLGFIEGVSGACCGHGIQKPMFMEIN